MEYRDYYKIFGVARTATADEIRNRYRPWLANFTRRQQGKDAGDENSASQEAYELKIPRSRAPTTSSAANGKSGEQFRPPAGTGVVALSFRGWPRQGRAGSGARGGARHAEEFEEAEGFSDFFSSLFGGGARGFSGGGANPFVAQAARNRA